MDTSLSYIFSDFPFSDNGFSGTFFSRFGKVLSSQKESLSCNNPIGLFCAKGRSMIVDNTLQSLLSENQFMALPSTSIQMTTDENSILYYFEITNADHLLTIFSKSYVFSHHSHIRQLFDNFFSSICAKEFPDIFQYSSRCYMLLMQLLKEQQCFHKYGKLVTETLDCIESRYPFLSGIQDVADFLSVNKNHLIRTFTKEVGTSPGVYLQQVRMEKAKFLLSTTAHTLSVISSMIGYANANYFGKVFLKETGETPRHYRREHYRSVDSLSSEEIKQLKQIEQPYYL